MTEIAEAEKISKSYVSRILRLALLAPDIVEAILGGWADQRVMLERLERPLPVGWEEQRALLQTFARSDVINQVHNGADRRIRSMPPLCRADAPL